MKLIIYYFLILLFGLTAHSSLAQFEKVLYKAKPVSTKSEFWRSSVLLSFHKVRGRQMNIATCTGVFITSQHILTAGHCLDNLASNSTLGVSFYYGSSMYKTLYLNIGNFGYRDYSPNKMDIGILDLRRQIFPSNAFRQVGVIDHYESVLQSNPKFFLVGAGRVGVNHQSFSDDFVNQRIQLNFVTGTLNSSSNGGQSATSICSGDSGGPIFRRKSSGGYELIGIAIEVSHFHSKNGVYCSANGRFQLVDKNLVNWLLASFL